MLWDSEQRCWGFKSPGLWHVIGQVVPDILKDCGAFIFKGPAVQEEFFLDLNSHSIIIPVSLNCKETELMFLHSLSWFWCRTHVTCENWRREDCTFLMGTNEITFLHVPWNSLTFATKQCCNKVCVHHGLHPLHSWHLSCWLSVWKDKYAQHALRLCLLNVFHML